MKILVEVEVPYISVEEMRQAVSSYDYRDSGGDTAIDPEYVDAHDMLQMLYAGDSGLAYETIRMETGE